MKLVVTLLARDEQDIITDNVEYHLNAGADLVIVTDNGSVDATRDLLKPFVDVGAARVLVEPAPVHSQWRWVTRMARIAYWDHNADWIINTDADEFWWPEVGTLKEALVAVPAEYATVRVPRFDFRPLVGVGGGPRDTPYRETASLRFIGGPLEPKTCHRGDPRVIVGQGNHEVSGITGADLDGAGLLSVFHYPTRSREQFRRGVGNAGAAYRRSTEFEPTTGEVKKALYETLEDGTLEDVFDTRELTVEQAEAGVRSGTIVVDRRLMGALTEQPAIGAERPDLAVVSLTGETSPVVTWFENSGHPVGEVVPGEWTVNVDAGVVVACVPAPEEWIGLTISDDTDVEEAAYAWLQLVAAIGACSSPVVWLSNGNVGSEDIADLIASSQDDGVSRSRLDAFTGEAPDVGDSVGPSLALARSAYAVMRAQPNEFRPFARLLKVTTSDPLLASRLGWYLGPPDAGTDVLGDLAASLAGAEASYEVLTSRRSVRAALKAADVAALAARGMRWRRRG